MKKQGFTLVEMLIAISITTLIISGISIFLTKVTDSIFESQNKTKISVSLSDFVEKMNSIRTRFASGSIIDTSGYDVLLFTNTGGTAGALVGVVSYNNSLSGYLLDTNTPFEKTNPKLLGIQDLTMSQVAQVKTGTGASAFTVPFQVDSIYTPLVAKTFSATPYQSGTILDIDLELYNTLAPEKSSDESSYFRLDF